MLLSGKEKAFSKFLDAFLKSRLNFKHFEKEKLTLIAFVFPNLRFPKTWLDKYLKRPVSGDLSTNNMAHVPKPVEICITASLSYLVIPAKSIQLEKVSLIEMQSLGTAC